MSNLTKKNYEAIAKVFYAYISTGTGVNIAKPLAKDLADYFTTDNPKFNRARFLAACGIQQKEVIDKVRCNNCMNVYDEDILECPKCKTDEYLMQPFMS